CRFDLISWFELYFSLVRNEKEKGKRHHRPTATNEEAVESPAYLMRTAYPSHFDSKHEEEKTWTPLNNDQHYLEVRTMHTSEGACFRCGTNRPRLLARLQY
ncbi:unnamed protein product, partial [Ectocarpus sp. 12 AP-2014]